MKCQQKSWTGFIFDLVWVNPIRSTGYAKSRARDFSEYSFNTSRNATGVPGISGSDWPRSLTEFTLSVFVEGFGMTNPLGVIPSASEESFLMPKVGPRVKILDR